MNEGTNAYVTAHIFSQNTEIKVIIFKKYFKTWIINVTKAPTCWIDLPPSIKKILFRTQIFRIFFLFSSERIHK